MGVAKDTIADLLEFSATTPFQFQDIAKAGAQLLAFGVDADNVRTRLQQIGDVASAAGQPIREIADIFGKVKGEAKLTGERLNQLQERAVAIGPAIISTLEGMGKGAEIAGKSVKELVAEGRVTFEVFDKAFASLSQKGGPAFEGMIKQSKTLTGLISTLKDNFSLLVIGLGNEFLPQFKEAASTTIGFLQRLQQDKALQETVIRVLKVASVLATMKLAWLAGGASLFKFGAIAFNVAGSSMGLLTTSLRSSTLGLRLMSRAILRGGIPSLKSLKLAVRGLMGATGFGLIITFLPEIIGFLKLFWKDAFATSKATIDALTGMLKGLGTIFKGAFSFDLDKIKAGFKQITDATRKFSKDKAKILRDSDKKQETAAEKAERTKARKIQKVIDAERELANIRQQEFDQERIDALKKKYENLTNEELGALKNKLELEKQSLIEYQRTLGAIESAEVKQKQGKINELIAIDRDRARERKEAFLAEDAQAIVKKYEHLTVTELEAMLKKEEQRRELELLQADQKKILEIESQNISDAEKQARFEAETMLGREQAAKRRAEEIKWAKLRNQDVKTHGETLGNLQATVREALFGKEIQGFKNFARSYTALQSSQNQTLKSIGKAAAITQIGISSAQSAFQVFAMVNAALPLLAPFVGFAAAAPIVAHGLENIRNVRRAQRGGMVTQLPGTPRLGDHQPILAEPGELILPRRDVELVREASKRTVEGNDRGRRKKKVGVDVNIGIQDDASSIIFAETRANRALGIGVT